MTEERHVLHEDVSTCPNMLGQHLSNQRQGRKKKMLLLAVSFCLENSKRKEHDMQKPMRHQPGKSSYSTPSATFHLASWRWRHNWFLLSIITIGMIAAIVIVGTASLFANIMNTAGLRQVLSADPDSAEIQVNAVTSGFSKQVVNSVQNSFADMIKQDLGNLVSPSQFLTISTNYSFATPSKNPKTLLIYGVSMQQAAAHLGTIQGSVAQITTAQQHELEVMMTPDSAQALGLKIGDTFPLQMTFSAKPSSPVQGTPSFSSQTLLIPATLSGLFTVNVANAAYWHGDDFKHTQISSSNGTTYSYEMLVPNESLLAIADSLAAQYDSSAAQSQTDAIFLPAQTLRWYYQLDVSHITIDQLDKLITACGTLQTDYTTNYGSLEGGSSPLPPTFPYLTSTQLSSPLLSGTNAPSNLESFRSRIDVAQVPVVVFLVQIIFLILFFISLMTNLMIESQVDAIALLRSRGASSGQVFGSILIYYIILGLIAFVTSLPLTMLTTALLSRHFLPAAEQGAIGLITSNLWQTLEQIVWYAGSILLVMLLTMLLSLYFAVRTDVLALRRTSSRTNKRPFWQRFNLDIFIGVIALAGYVLSFYLSNVSNMLDSGTQALVVTPLSIIAPFFLVIGCLFLLLRVFPLLLRLGAWLTTRGKGAVSMLALVQISRTPRQSIRMTMILALSVAFLLFTVIYQSTQTQHIQDLTNYLASADFSGGLMTGIKEADQTTATRSYQAIPGVITATMGFIGTGQGGTGNLSMDINAVNADNFGQTVIWPSPAEAQAGNALLAKLVTIRNEKLPGTAVPAIIDTSTMNKLRLQVGSLLPLTVDGYESVPINCLVIGVVPHIPTINDATAFDNQGQPLAVGGVLFDYQAYITAFTSQVKGNPQLAALTPPLLNHVWLHTHDDPASVASVRTGLVKFNLADLSDRRAIVAELNDDPLYLILSGTLVIGTLTALLLALMGNLLTSWLSARTRLTNFAVLRAIGSTPRQIASMLTWEQAIVYLTGLLLGVSIGAFIAKTVIPAITLTDFNTNVSSNQFYSLQTIFPAQIVLPATLLLVLLALGIIYGIALTMMVRIVSRPSLSQVLRLNAD